VALQAEFGDDLLTEFGTRGMWEDVRAFIAQLVAVGPPTDEVVHPPADKEADEACEVSLPVQETVHWSADAQW